MTWKVGQYTHPRWPFVVWDDEATRADDRYVLRPGGKYARRWAKRDAAQQVADRLNEAVAKRRNTHEPLDAYQVRHPGGKDGMWRAGCTCGYLSGFDSKRAAESARDQHVTAKLLAISTEAS